MSKWISPLLAVVALVGFFVVVSSESAVGIPVAPAADDAKPGAGYKLVAPLEVVMEVTDDMFYELEKKIDAAKGNARKLKSIRKDAQFLAEMGNLVSHGTYEEVKTDAHRKKWQELCGAMKDQLLALATATMKKGAAAAEVKAPWSKAEAACDSCHETFRDI